MTSLHGCMHLACTSFPVAQSDGEQCEIISPPTKTPDLKHFNWHAMDNLQRDKEQSRALHEPRFRIMKTDPISGHDVDDYLDHCSLIDGNLKIYFDTEENRKAFKAMRFDHPNLHLPFSASVDDDRGG